MHDLPLNAGTSRFVLTLVGLGRPIGRPGRGLNLAFGSRSLKHRGPPVPKSNPKPNKYANKSPQLRDAGFLVTLGGADEIAHHYRKHFQHLLEQLTIDESAPNWLEKVGDGNPELQQAMCRAGLTGLTREQLRAKSDEYLGRLEAGEELFSSKLYGVEWIPAN